MESQNVASKLAAQHTISQIDTGQVRVEKKRDWKIFQSYDLHVQYGSKTVTVRMNTFKFPWSKNVKVTNFTKELLQKLDIAVSDEGQVSSLMRVWADSALEMQKLAAVARPENRKYLKKMVDNADASVRAMKAFIKQYPSGIDEPALEIFTHGDVFRLDPKPDPLLPIKKDMALLCHEIMRSKPRKEVIKAINQKLNEKLQTIKGDPEQKKEVLEQLRSIDSAIQKREGNIETLASVDKKINAYGFQDDIVHQEVADEGKVMSNASFILLSSKVDECLWGSDELNMTGDLLESENHQILLGQLVNILHKNELLDDEQCASMLQSPLSLSQFVNILSKIQAKIDEYKNDCLLIHEDLNRQIREKAEPEVEKYIQEEKRLDKEEAEEIRQLEQKCQNDYENIEVKASKLRNDLTEHLVGKKTGKTIAQLNDEIESISAVEGHLSEQLREINEELDSLTTDSVPERNWDLLVASLLSDTGKPHKEELAALAKDIKDVVKYPYWVARQKISEFKNKKNPDFKRLQQKFGIIESQYDELNERKLRLIQEKNEVEGEIQDGVDELLRRPVDEFNKGEEEIKKRTDAIKEEKLDHSKKRAGAETKLLVKERDKAVKRIENAGRISQKINRFHSDLNGLINSRSELMRDIPRDTGLIIKRFSLQVENLSDSPLEESYFESNLLAPLQAVTSAMVSSLENDTDIPGRAVEPAGG